VHRETDHIQHTGLVAAVEQAADSVVVVDTTGKIQYVNPAFTLMTGYTSEEAVGQNPRVLKSGRQSSAFYEELWNTIRSGGVWHGELINRRKDGTFYNEEMQITPVRGTNGEIDSYIAIKRDVTRRRAAEGAQRFLAAIVETSEDAIISSTPAGVILTWNRGAEAIFGHSAGDMVGQHVSMLMTPERLPDIAHFTGQVSQGITVSQYESVCLRQDGTKFHVSVTGSPLMNAAGEVVALSAILRDISNRREGEQARALLASIVESSDDAIASLALNGTIVSWNNSAERLFGYRADEIVGKDAFVLAVPGCQDPDGEVLAKIRTGAVSRYDSVWRTKDDRLIDVAITTSAIRNPDGELVGTSVIVRDICDRVRSEQKLRDSEARFRGAFEMAPFGMCLTQLNGRFIQVNSTLCRILEYSENELLRLTFAEITHSEDRDSSLQGVELLLADPSHCLEMEKRYIRRSGKMVWARTRISLVQDSSGSALYFVAHVEEITEQRQAEKALRESEERFRIMADGCPTVMWVTNAEGGIQFINRAFRELIGTTCEQMEGSKWRLMLHPADAPEYIAAFERAVQEHTPFRAEARSRSGDGQWRWFASYAEPRFSADGEFLGHVGISPDITDRKQVEQALQRSEEKFRQLAENICEVFWMMNAAATELLYVSPAYRQIWGQSCESVYAHPESRMESIHPDDRERAGETFFRQVRGEILENEYRIVRPSGDIRWIRDRAFPVRDGGGNIVRVAGIAEDVTQWKLAESQLVHQALYDELTDLPNRRLFRQRLERAIAECETGKTGAIFFIDIDRFKLVNDTLGHAAGDQLLKEIAQRLLAVCGETGTLARFGGEEFTLVAAGFPRPESVRDLGNKLVGCLEEPFRIADREVFISASIGISLFPENGTDPSVLKTNANVAMHEAKRAGRHQIKFFSVGFADAARERLEMETRLRRALALSEFKLQFQPQFASGKSRPSRFEALIRWHPTEDQLILPLKFIALAEENGLIVPIGTWVLREACRRCADWQTGNLKGAGVAVNVSALQFVSPEFVEIVARTLESTGLPPRLLELELTESVFVADLQASARTLARLRNLGVTIALDDFGTGYSSLSYLQNLPIDALKIDRSFLTGAQGRQQGEAVLRCVVELAHILGLRVIGEGVETTAQLDLLGSLGCDEIQGFLLGKPSFDVADAEFGRTWNSTSSDGADGDLARLHSILITTSSESLMTEC
jgi:diguanylate cyclase (GGDEF)-like protein/PAS domain S-box-containing protein